MYYQKLISETSNEHHSQYIKLSTNNNRILHPITQSQCDLLITSPSIHSSIIQLSNTLDTKINSGECKEVLLLPTIVLVHLNCYYLEDYMSLSLSIHIAVLIPTSECKTFKYSSYLKNIKRFQQVCKEQLFQILHHRTLHTS